MNELVPHTVTPPSSSPASSPSLLPVDSSPASSCANLPFEPIDLDEGSDVVRHPFAASMHATRSPPDYEKRPGRGLPVGLGRSSELPKKRPRRSELTSEETYDLLYSQSEQDVWTNAIDEVIDKGIGHISLSDCQLKSIPTAIGDLANFVAFPKTMEDANISSAFTAQISEPRSFRRVATAPARGNALFSSSMMERTHSGQLDTSLGTEKHQIRMFLDGNQLWRLPRELFNVTKLKVLALRNNSLTYIPPEIALLVNLTELSIGGNSIRYLPSEIVSMNIPRLTLIPNPFIQTQSAGFCGPLRRLQASNGSDVKVPPLTELMSRVLLLPHTTHSKETALEAIYSLPLDTSGPDSMPEHLRILLHDCAPRAIRSPPTRLSTEPIYGPSICPSPKHTHEAPSKFVRPMEERFTWLHTIAGCGFGETRFPVRWRGCSIGCLNYLDPQQSDPSDNESLSADDSMDVDDTNAPQVMTFETNVLGFEQDFDDDD